MSINKKNMSNDFLPTIPMDFDCCLIFKETKDFSKLPLYIPLSNILSSADELRVASHKVDEVEDMIKEQEVKDYSQYYRHITSWSAVISTLVLLMVSCCCCCCCCKGYRILWFRLWDRWSPKTCWKETTEKLCINITNIQGKQPSVRYQAMKTSPTTSITSLPNVLTLIPDDDEKEEIKESLPVPLRPSLREKNKTFR